MNNEDIVLRPNVELRAASGEVLGLEDRITKNVLFSFSLMTVHFLSLEEKGTLVQDFTRQNCCNKSCYLPIQSIGVTGSGLQDRG